LSLAQGKLDKEVAAAPEDPDVRLRYAEVMFVAGKFELAVAKLDEAIKVIGGLEKSTDASQRESDLQLARCLRPKDIAR